MCDLFTLNLKNVHVTNCDDYDVKNTYCKFHIKEQQLLDKQN